MSSFFPHFVLVERDPLLGFDLLEAVDCRHVHLDVFGLAAATVGTTAATAAVGLRRSGSCRHHVVHHVEVDTGLSPVELGPETSFKRDFLADLSELEHNWFKTFFGNLTQDDPKLGL